MLNNREKIVLALMLMIKRVMNFPENVVFEAS